MIWTIGNLITLLVGPNDAKMEKRTLQATTIPSNRPGNENGIGNWVNKTRCNVIVYDITNPISIPSKELNINHLS